MDTDYFDFYITGTPRSGSAWLSTLFTAHDFICLHEPTRFPAEWILSQLKIRKMGAACPSFVYLERAQWLIDERSKVIVLERKDWKEAYSKFLNNPEFCKWLRANSKAELIESLINDFDEELANFKYYIVDKKIQHVTVDFETLFTDEKRLSDVFNFIGCRLSHEKFIQMKNLKIVTNEKPEL